jgi:PAS domain S-box-containing protein
MPDRPLNLLIVEDSEADAELILRELRRSGFAPEWKRVETELDFCASLNSKIDIVLSDYAMPQFDGLRALELLKKYEVDVPFIIVSGTIGEELAVKAMQKGAADYLLKDRLARLGQAVQHALDQKRIEGERNRVEADLQILTNQHELILNSAGEGVHGIDLDGRIIFENPKACALLRWKLDELIGQPAHATIHHNHPDGSPYPVEKCPIYATMRDGQPRRVTNDVFWRRDGSSFRVDYVAAPVRDAAGKITGSIVTFKDITEQFAAEQRLNLQEQQYRLLFQTNPNSMWVFDVKTLRILAVNESALAEYGYSREEFLKLTLGDLRPPEEAEKLHKAISPAGEPAHYSGEFRHQRKDGSQIDVAIYSSPLIWEGAKARMVTAIDITERKESLQRLREQAEIIDRAHDAVIIRDFESDEITFWNSGAEHLYGWANKEALGKRLGDLIFTESAERTALIEQLLSLGEYHGEIKHRRKDGREVIVDSRTTLIRDDDGQPRAVLGINTDVTEKKKLEMQLLRAQRLESIGTLAGGVAHDLNNILTPILMCSEMLHNEQSEEDRQSTIALIEESAHRGANVVKQVLTFARGVEGERVLLKAKHLIEEMIDIANRTFPKSISVRGNYPQDLWSIDGDPTQLHQVLLNLSVNARDAMPDGGSLTLSAENFVVDEHYAAMRPELERGPYVLISISDTGSGMSRATVDKIFDPFFSTKEVGKGTGLGLSTALGIVKSHGGFISVYSELRKGTTFKIFLPASTSDVEVAKSKAALVPIRGNGEYILVVDDEPNILQSARMIFEKHNYRIVLAADGAEAVALFARQIDSIAGVLTDVAMPYMDGVAFVRAIKKLKADIPIVASSGFGDQAAKAELETLGVKNFLTKPYNADKLLTVIRDALAPSL